MGKLDGKVAIVTGGGRGIGARYCRGLAAEGARVMVADINEAGARQVAGEFGGASIRVDVADAQSVQRQSPRHRAVDGATGRGHDHGHLARPRCRNGLRPCDVAVSIAFERRS